MKKSVISNRADNKVSRGELHLCAEDSGVPDIVADDGDGFHIWGVVTQVIKTMPV